MNSIHCFVSRPRLAVFAWAALAAALPSLAAVNVKINFQPDASAVPAGFIKDIGLPFDAARGFGWVTEASLSTASHVPLDLRPNSRDRARAGIAPELNTQIQFQDPIVQAPRINTRGAWEYAVPAGTYQVTVSVGDQSPYDSHHFLNVEGASAVSNFVGSAAKEFQSATVFVTVTDGRLTVDGLGGTNTKINYVSILSADGPPGTPGDIGIENLDGVPYPDRLVFSRINGSISTHKFHDVSVLRVRNTGAGALTLTGLDFTVAGKWRFPNNDQNALPFSIAPGGFRDIPIKFVENTGGKGIREGELVIASDDPDEAQVHVQLAGAYMTAPEGGNEVFNPAIMAAYGYRLRQLLNGESLSIPYLSTGEEIFTTDWRRAAPAFPVTVRQIAAFHGCCGSAVLFEIVGTGGASFRHDPAYGQSFLPLKQNSTGPAAATLNPTSTFKFRIAGYTAPYNAAGHGGVRVWPARDRDGLLIPDTYYVIQDYVNAGASANYDFNDDIYIVTNIQPVDNKLNPNIAGLYPGVPGLVLDFNRDYPGTLADKDGLATGFAKTESNKIDRSNVASSYLPANLDKDVSAGTLTVTTASGSNAGSDNTLVNGLVLPFDGRLTRFSVRGTLLNPAATLNASGRQAGVMMGPNRDNGIRLTAGVFTAGGAFSVQFQKESGGTASTVSTTAINATGLKSLELVLLGNPATGVVTAAYKAVYASSQTGLVALPGSVTLPAGVEYNKYFDRRSYGGILAAHGGSTATQAVFDRFAVQSEAGSGTGTIRLVDVAAAAPYTAADGRVWGTDAGLFTPSTTKAESWGAPAIANTVDDVLYHTYRSQIPGSPPQDQRTLTFNIPIASPRTVLVKLHYAEVYWGAPNGGPANPGPGKRVFDIIVEGKTVLKDFDISAAAGGALNALVIPIENVQVNDGSLTLSFKAKVDFGSLNALEVLQQ
ncbi:MAG TPA: malectin domain-containing carbohydrate-binding protein [Fibrobacteria bacterium]|nr:malectin domain-containing carbohydrate-binding protein [Fibrobacteria bacterium]